MARASIPRRFFQESAFHISKTIGQEVKETTNHFQAQSSLDEIVEVSGILKTIAVSLMKIANDMRWLGCGPRAGIAELALPEVQPGSSIMPGKSKPVIAEAVCMVAAQVIGNDVTVSIAGQSGNFELNVMQPVAAYNLLQSINLLGTVQTTSEKSLVDGLKATENGPHLVERGLSLCTALVPEIGYDLAASISHDAFESGETIGRLRKKRLNLQIKTLSVYSTHPR